MSVAAMNRLMRPANDVVRPELGQPDEARPVDRVRLVVARDDALNGKRRKL